MMVLQVFSADGWRKAQKTLEEKGATPLGSLSSCGGAGPRELYIFGWLNGVAGVWRSLGGVDVEVGPLRAVMATGGLELLHQFSGPDSPYPIHYLTLDRPDGKRIEVRIWLEDDES